MILVFIGVPLASTYLLGANIVKIQAEFYVPFSWNTLPFARFSKIGIIASDKPEPSMIASQGAQGREDDRIPHIGSFQAIACAS